MELPTVTVNFYKCLKNILTGINPEKIKGDSAYRVAIQKSADSTKETLGHMADEMRCQYTDSLRWGFPGFRPTPADVSGFVGRLLKNSCALVDEAAHGSLTAQQMKVLQNDNSAKMLESVYKNN